MNKTVKRWVAVAATAGALVVALTSCGKMSEPWNDADVSGQNKGAAEIVNMPDGFSNVATKCDHGNRIYVAYHADSPYAAVAVVPNDPSCAK